MDVEKPEPATRTSSQPSPRRRLRLPRTWPAWLAVIVPTLVHLGVAVSNVRADAHASVPAASSLGDLGLTEAFRTYISLFVKPDAGTDSLRMFALWVLVLLGLSIYTAMRDGRTLPSGVVSFMGYGLAAAVMLAVATPAVWYLFGASGPAAAEFVPPLLLGLVAALVVYSRDELPSLGA